MAAAYDIEVFFDGDCPLCRREINFLQRRDHQHRIRFTNIAATDFDAGAFAMQRQDFAARIRGRLPNGTFIEGVEVFRRLYSAIGYNTLVRVTRLPGISHLLALGYTWFAKHRLQWTGRCTDDACGALPQDPSNPDARVPGSITSTSRAILTTASTSRG